MKKTLRTVLIALLALFCATAWGQATGEQKKYKVKKKDTIYGIARKYDLTIDELLNANPEMKAEGYSLKAGDYVLIPYPSTAKVTRPAASAAPAGTRQGAQGALQGRHLSVGVLLPLHNNDGDGRRMTEYYRGLLMACDSLKAEGLSVDVHAWNVSIDSDITQFMPALAAARCDVVFGPLYSKQVHGLAEFCKARDIKMVIPFSISGDDVSLYPQIFQVYQSDDRLANNIIESFLKTFHKAHPVFVDCNDKTSKKGTFTFGLRTRLESNNIRYGITNVTSSDDAFSKQFSASQQNVVILNSARSPELTQVMNKLASLKAAHPELRLTLFGYTEWLMYLQLDEARFHQFDTYIPSTFYYNASDPRTAALSQSYQQWFHTPMQQALPRFAITGYDQGQFFLRGLARYGKAFKGTREQNRYRALQSPLVFKQISTAGMQNDYLQLIHFLPNGNIEALSY